MLATIYQFCEYAFFITLVTVIFYCLAKSHRNNITRALSLIAVVLLLFSATIDVIISRKVYQALPNENQSNIITIDENLNYGKNMMAKNLAKTLKEENIEICTVIQKEGTERIYLQVIATDGDAFEFDFNIYEIYRLLPYINFDRSPLVE